MLSRTKMFGYSIGDLGINLNFQLIGFYLAYFYTDVFKISASHVAWLFLIARFWDALLDPLMGYIADHTRSRWGRFRPYLLFGAIPLNLVLVACFLTPSLSPTGRVIYAYVTYFLHGTVFTLVGLPYSSISAAITQDPQERAVISSYRMFFAVIMAMTIVTVGVKPLANYKGFFATEQQGFAGVAIVFAIISVALLWYSFTQAEERIAPSKEQYKAAEIPGMLLKNTQLLLASLAMLLNTCVWVISGGVATYFFKYILGDETAGFQPDGVARVMLDFFKSIMGKDAGLQSMFFFCMLPANILGVLIAPILTKRIGKARTFIWGSVIVAVFYVLRHYVPASSITLFIVLSMVATTGQMFCSITQWAMVPDTVEYGHYRTGKRSEGIPIAFFSFTQKAGLALGGFVASFVMDQTGYVPNQAQSAASLTGIAWLFNIVPAIMSVLCAIVLVFYKLDGPLFETIKAKIATAELPSDQHAAPELQ